MVSETPYPHRARLARRLAVRAALGLVLLLAVLAALVLASAASASVVWHFAEGEEWSLAIAWSVVAVAVAAFTLRLSSCVFVPNPPPVGVPLSRELAPSLHALIDRVGDQFGGLRAHTLWITGEMNAAVLQRPRWGLVGPLETHLLLGLPLTHSVSERQLRAILAHEFGHLFHQRQSHAAWGCHLRAWWFRAVDHCILFMPPIGQLLDRLTLSEITEAQMLARMDEFEADRAAARAVGAGLVAETLVEVAARERFLRCDFWVKVMAQCAQGPRPTVRPYREMGLGMLAGFLPGDGRADCLSFAGGDEDGLHPSLAERIRALEVTPGLDVSVEDTVAERHLSLLLPRLAWELDRRWWAETRGAWRSHYLNTRRGDGSAA